MEHNMEESRPKDHYRYSTKSKKSLRLSAKRKKPGMKKGAKRKIMESYNVAYGSFGNRRNEIEHHAIQSMPTNNGFTESTSGIERIPKPRKRLTLSTRRKKRYLPLGLINWRIQAKIKKLRMNGQVPEAEEQLSHLCIPKKYEKQRNMLMNILQSSAHPCQGIQERRVLKIKVGLPKILIQPKQSSPKKLKIEK